MNSSLTEEELAIIANKLPDFISTSTEFKVNKEILIEMGIDEQDVVERLQEDPGIKCVEFREGKIFVETHEVGNFTILYTE